MDFCLGIEDGNTGVATNLEAYVKRWSSREKPAEEVKTMLPVVQDICIQCTMRQMNSTSQRVKRNNHLTNSL